MTTTTTSPKLDTLFTRLHSSPLRRSPNGVLGGVCAGIATKLDVHPNAVRLVAVLSLFTVVGGPAYLLAWALLPDERGTVHLEGALRHGRGASLLLVGVALLALVGLLTPWDGFAGLLFAAALVVGGVWAYRRWGTGQTSSVPPVPQDHSGPTVPPAPTGTPVDTRGPVFPRPDLPVVPEQASSLDLGPSEPRG